MSVRRTLWIVALAFGLWACGSSGGDSGTDTVGGDTAADVSTDGLPEENAEEVAPDAAPETTPDTVEETTPDTAPETTPDTAEETTPDTAEETTPDTAEETTPDTAEETTPDTAEETTPDAVEETTPDTDTVQPASEFETLIAYLEGEGGDYLNGTAAPKTITAADVMAAGLDTYVILDLRTKDLGAATDDGFVLTPNGVVDFDEGHIEGSTLVDWTQVVTYVTTNLTKDDKILLVCWSGQSASQATSMLNLLGYDAWFLKFGMSGWNKRFDMWSASISSDWAGQFTTDADTGKNPAGDYPELATGETDGAAILAARIAEYSTGKAKSIKAADLFADLESYYVVNYWPEAEYLAPGHIVGSHQYTPKASLKSTAELATLPTDQKIVVYCYTGQHSATVTAFLNILGYDAYSLQYGTNGLIYDQMTKQQWTGPGDYAYVSNVTPPTEFETLVTHLEGDGGNYLNTAAPKVVAAADVLAAGLESWVILDLRNKDFGVPTADGFVKTPNGELDFDDGHIEGAINVGWADLVAYVKTNLTTDDKILLVCWTGQSASQASLMLNLLGYDSSSLKWGMSGWNKQFDMVSASISSDWAGQFTTDPDTGKNAAGDYPTLSTGETDAAAILDARIAAYSAGSAKSVKAADLFADLESYYVVNYWPEAEYLAPGHIIGSHQYTPKTSLLTTADLATLPTDQKIVVYCYTGQTSSQVAAYLNILGYDAYSLQFGTNGMIYDQMTKNQWTGSGDYAFVSTVPEFKKLVGYLEGAGGNYLNSAAAPKVITAADVMSAGLETYVILDLRDQDLGVPATDGFVKTPNGTLDFDDGHIEGATMVGWANVVQYVKTNLTKDDKILLVCWTGQSASQAASMLNLLGYDAWFLKFGMSGWNKQFDLWSASISSDWAGQFTTDPDTGKNPAGDYPELTTGETEATAILEARIAAYSAGKAKSIKAVDLFADLESYYVINYWPEAEYLAPGHIVGSHQYNVKAAFHTGADLATLPTDQKIVVYCYTGQHSSTVTAYLNILGYDAYSLQFGANGMIFDQMIKQQWTGSGDYAFVQ